MTIWRRFGLGVAAVLLFCASVNAQSTTIVISQIYSAEDFGQPGGPRLRHDYVELFNLSDETVDLDGWGLQVAPADGVDWALVDLTGSLDPGQYLLVQFGRAELASGLPRADITSTIRLQAQGGKIALTEDDFLLDVDCAAFYAVDVVNYGTNSCNTQASAMNGRLALVRAGGGCVDADGGEDFSLVAPYPRTSRSPRNVCGTGSALRSFSVPANGGVSIRTAGNATNIEIGHIRIQRSGNATTPNGLAIFSFRQGGTLLSEATVPAAPLIRAGQLYAEVNGPINTGIAISNPNNEETLVDFEFIDSNRGFATLFGSFTVPPQGQISRFLNELPFSLGSSIQGTFVFRSEAPVAVIALRGFTNERGEFLVTTLPVLDTTAPPFRDPSFLAHFAVAGGWRTEMVVMNTATQAVTGTLEFRNAAGAPATLKVGTETASSFSYSLTPNNSHKFLLTGVNDNVLTGSVRIVPSQGTATPVAIAVFSYRRNNVVVSEAGLVSIRGTRFRTYVEYSGALQASGSIQPGFAIANTGTSAVTVDLELTRLDGASTGQRVSVPVPASGQVAKFLNEVFPGVAAPFQGILRVTAPSSIALVGLRGRYNERGDFLITTVPAVDETVAPSSAELVFPHIADSEGYTTQILLFGSAGQAASGNLRLLSTGGQPLGLEFQ